MQKSSSPIGEPTGQNVITAAGVSKVFCTATGATTAALHNLNLEVKLGEFLCIVGPSGCGKSTFLSMIAGLEFPTCGDVCVSSRKVSGPRPDVAMVFQEHAIFPWKTVIDNVAIGLKARGMGKRERKEAAQRYIELGGLKGFEQSYPGALSGGMKQRVGIARALAVEPDVLLMDEPFGALDAQTRAFFQEELLRIYDRVKTTVVFITHSVKEAVYLADRIAVMTFRPGCIKEVISVPLDRPRSLSVYDDKEFANTEARVWNSVKEEAERSFVDRET